jgi:hypothetical protein
MHSSSPQVCRARCRLRHAPAAATRREHYAHPPEPARTRRWQQRHLLLLPPPLAAPPTAAPALHCQHTLLQPTLSACAVHLNPMLLGTTVPSTARLQDVNSLMHTSYHHVSTHEHTCGSCCFFSGAGQSRSQLPRCCLPLLRRLPRCLDCCSLQLRSSGRLDSRQLLGGISSRLGQLRCRYPPGSTAGTASRTANM